MVNLLLIMSPKSDLRFFKAAEFLEIIYSSALTTLSYHVTKQSHKIGFYTKSHI